MVRVDMEPRTDGNEALPRRVQSGRGRVVPLEAGSVGVNTETLRNWIRAADGRRPAAHSTPCAAAAAQVPGSMEGELVAARKRIRELEEERDIFRKLPGISPGRRACDPLPVRRRPPAPLRRQAAMHHHRDRPVQLLLLAQDRVRAGRPAGRRRPARVADRAVHTESQDTSVMRVRWGAPLRRRAWRTTAAP